MIKRILILGMVMALVATMVMPAAVFAAGTTDVTGTFTKATITFSAPVAAAFGEFTNTDGNLGLNTTIPGTPGSVIITQNSQRASARGWTASAIDTNTAIGTKGFMLSGENKFPTKLQISKLGTSPVYADADMGVTYIGTGTPGSLPFSAQQTVVDTAAVGIYAITITFTASLTN